ncbi:MAG TPA: sodium:solute symporter family protein [Candidatus Aminicenantes bacterium]|nr:sodium:solute symporter family protein [Candidatus Aminicenantes bacterium]
MEIRMVVVGLYCLLIVAVGVIGMRRTHSFADFFLAGGKVGPWMSAFSYGTAYFSAVVFIGFAGNVGWNFGLSGLWIALFNAFLGVLGVWGLLGWKIKQVSTRLQVSTMNEYLERRYDSPFLKLFASIAVFVFLVPYSAAVFKGLSYLFKSNFNVEYWQALVFMGILTGLYMVMGGYKSMAMIDTVFGIIMTVGVVVLLFFTLDKGGGLDGILSQLRDIPQVGSRLAGVIGPPGWWPLFCLVFLTSVAPFAMPHLVQKFYAIRDRRAIRHGKIASTFFAVLIGGSAYFLGATTRVFLSPEKNPLAFKNGVPQVDILMPELLTRVIPESLSVIILLLILSASMSTLAALVLVSSSSFAKDFYGGFINKCISDRNLTRLMRVASSGFILISVLLAYLDLKTIVAILGISWGAIGSTFLGPFVWGLFSKRATRAAAKISAFIGLTTCLVLHYGFQRASPEAGTIGMLVSLLIPPVVFLFQHARKSEQKNTVAE